MYFEYKVQDSHKLPKQETGSAHNFKIKLRIVLLAVFWSGPRFVKMLRHMNYYPAAETSDPI